MVAEPRREVARSRARFMLALGQGRLVLMTILVFISIRTSTNISIRPLHGYSNRSLSFIGAAIVGQQHPLLACHGRRRVVPFQDRRVVTTPRRQGLLPKGPIYGWPWG